MDGTEAIMINITWTGVRNCRWNNAAQTEIYCEVAFDHEVEDWVPFTTMASGDYPHTHDIHAEILAGDWGAIADYVDPGGLTGNTAIEILRQTRDQLLKETDHWGLSDTTTMTQAQIDYRQALRDLPANSSNVSINWSESDNDFTGWVNVTWPTKP